MQDEAAGVLGCAHYKRSCKIKAACCKRWYCCRICHDDDQDHQINRYRPSAEASDGALLA